MKDWGIWEQIAEDPFGAISAGVYLLGLLIFFVYQIWFADDDDLGHGGYA